MKARVAAQDGRYQKDISFLNTLTAREGEVIAKNNFLLELTKLEMRMGTFSFLRTPTELNEFHERYGLKT
ncbi:MAG: hypothetical protein ACHQYQ_09160 [Bacteriovoracales bacterium]